MSNERWWNDDDRRKSKKKKKKPIPVLVSPQNSHTGFLGIESRPPQWNVGTESWRYTMTVYWGVKIHNEDV
jgi:peroxiredoxin